MEQALADDMIGNAIGMAGPISKAGKTRMVADLRRAHPDVKFDLMGEGDRVNLGRIIVPEGMRGKGVGSAFMGDLAAAADANQFTVTATPSSDFGGSKARVRAFNKRFGFVDNKGRNRDFSHMESMFRPPQARDLGAHRPPGPDSGAPLHDLTGGGTIYPDDVYGAQGERIYGTGMPDLDREAFSIARQLRGNPDATVTVYRAVPSDVKQYDIQPGDWVAITKGYAALHGARWDQGAKILSKKVRAADIFTNGDSIQEFGYVPTKKGP